MLTLIAKKIFLDIIASTTIWHMIFLELIVIVIEAAFIYFLLEKAAAKAFLSSFCANFITRDFKHHLSHLLYRGLSILLEIDLDGYRTLNG